MEEVAAVGVVVEAVEAILGVVQVEEVVLEGILEEVEEEADPKVVVQVVGVVLEGILVEVEEGLKVGVEVAAVGVVMEEMEAHREEEEDIQVEVGVAEEAVEGVEEDDMVPHLRKVSTIKKFSLGLLN